MGVIRLQTRGITPKAAAAATVGPVAVLAVALPWLIEPGGVGYDHSIHRRVVLGWLDAWRHGVAWPAYLDTPNAGLGSFWPSYYPPLFHVLTAAGMAAGLDFWRSSMSVMIIAQVGGAFLCYRWLRINGSEWAAACGSVAFALAPYTVLNYYVRGAFPEGFAIAWLPGVFLGIDAVRSGWDWRGAAPGIIGFALIALGNLPALIVAGVATACYLAASCLVVRDVSALVRGMSIPALGLALSAFSWMGAYLDSGLVWIPTGGSDVETNPVSRNYIYYGLVGVDAYGWMLYGICYFLMALSIHLTVAAQAVEGDPVSRLTGPTLAACGLFFCGNSASPFYLCLPLLHHVQFPWRFLGVMAPAMARLISSSAQSSRRTPRFLAAVGLISLLYFDLTLYRDGYRTNLANSPTSPSDETGALSEFVPKGCSTPADGAAPPPRVEIVPNGASAEVERWEPGLRTIGVRVTESCKLVIATYADPRWVVTDQAGEPLASKRWDALGRIGVAVTKGTTRVNLVLTPTDNVLTSRGLTILCLVDLLLIWVVNRMIGRGGAMVRPDSADP